MLKYKNKKTVIDGIKFDSILEGRFYCYFRDNNITILEFQPRFILQPSFRYDGKAIRTIEYRADFLIEYEGGKFIIDAKGMENAEFKIKKKMFLYKHGQDNTLIVAKSIKDLSKQISCN